MTRPTSISVLAWLTIVFAVFALVGSFSYGDPATVAIAESMGLNVRTQIAFSIFGGVVLSISGIGLLKGWGWARDLLVLYMIVSIIASYLMMGEYIKITAIPTAILYILALTVLYTPTTTAYLNGTYAPDTEYLELLRHTRRVQGTNNDLVRVVGVILLVGCALLLSAILLMQAMFETLPGIRYLVAVTLIFFSLPTLVGTLMWGRRRWMTSVGWVVIRGGAYGAMTILVLQQVFVMEEFRMYIDDPTDLPVMGSSVYSILVAMSGAMMVIMQRKKDHNAAESSLQNLRPAEVSLG